jgi:hypothetical protein
MKQSRESLFTGLALTTVLALGAACTNHSGEAEPSPSPSCTSPVKIKVLGKQQDGTLRAVNAGDCAPVGYQDNQPGVIAPSQEFTVTCVGVAKPPTAEIELYGKHGNVDYDRSFSYPEGAKNCPAPPVASPSASS